MALRVLNIEEVAAALLEAGVPWRTINKRLGVNNHFLQRVRRERLGSLPRRTLPPGSLRFQGPRSLLSERLPPSSLRSPRSRVPRVVLVVVLEGSE